MRPANQCAKEAAGALIPPVICWGTDVAFLIIYGLLPESRDEWMMPVVLTSFFVTSLIKPWIVGLVCSYYWGGIPRIRARYKWYGCVVMCLAMLPELVLSTFVNPFAGFLVFQVIFVSGFDFDLRYWPTKPWLVWSGREAHPYESIPRRPSLR